jgi:hypothetical protein
MLAHLAYASYVGFSAEMSTNAATWCRVGMHYEDQNQIAVLWMTREPSLHDSS